MSAPVPTPIFRMVHAECLRTIPWRGALHAANCTPADGLPYRTIDNADIHGHRHIRNIPKADAEALVSTVDCIGFTRGRSHAGAHGKTEANPQKSQAICCDLREAGWDCVGLESRFGQYVPIQPSRDSSPAFSLPASHGLLRRSL